MKVAVLFDNFGPYHLARLGAAAGVCELLALQVAGRSVEYEWEPEKSAEGFQVVTLAEQGTNRSMGREALQERLTAALRDFGPQAVLVPGWSSVAAFSALRWCADNQVPAVAMSESTVWDEPRVAWKEWVKRRIIGMCSSALVGGQPHREYINQLGLPSDQVFLGYDVVDNDYFSKRAGEIRKQKVESGRRHTSPGVPPPSPQSAEGPLPEKYFLASARFIEKKNLPRLLQAYARYRELFGKTEKLKAETPKLKSGEPSTFNLQPSTLPWHLVLLGDGELRSTLLARRASLGLDACVHLPGFKQYPDLPAYYGLASAFIHASTTEQWGLVVNEAMASGLPVLVSKRCGCAADLVQEGVNGFTFDPYDVEAIAQVMLKISALPSPPLNRLTSPSTALRAPSPPLGEKDGMRGCGSRIGEVSSAASESSTTLAEMEQASQEIIKGGGLDTSPQREELKSVRCTSSDLRSPSPQRGEGRLPDRGGEGGMGKPSSIKQASATLAEMGQASQEIIAAWGPERFANGLKQAVDCALKVGPKRARIIDRLLLSALIRR